MRARKAVLGCGLALVTWTGAACGDAQLDTDQAESAIKSGITGRTGVKIDSVRCPDEVKAEQGDTFRCVAIASNGERAQVEVTQRDDEGSVSWRLVRQPRGSLER
jgi:uncharacterized protein DUF4333